MNPAVVVACALVVLGVMIAVQTAFALVYAVNTMGNIPSAELGKRVEALATNGDVMAVSTILSSTVCLLLMIAMVKMKRGAELATYFPLEMPPARRMLPWLALAIGMMIAYDAIAIALGKPIVPEFSRQVWATSSDRMTLVAVIVVAAPVFEELLFRGFLMRGLLDTRLGERGAVLVTALLWAFVHLQYDWYGIAYIVLIGLLFGYARLRTGSLAVPILLHMLVNAVSTLETALIPP